MGCGFVYRTPVTAAPVTAPTARFEEGASNALVLTFAGNASTMDSTTEAEFQAQIQREIEARFGEMVVLRVDIPVKDPAVAVVIFERGSASPNALLLAQSSVQAQPIRISMPALNEDMVTVGAYPMKFDQPEGHPAIVTANGPSQCHKNTFDLLNSDPPPSVVFSGSWQQSTSTSRIAHLGQDELTTATFYPRMAQRTTVDVYLRYEAADEFASRVDVLVHSMNGATQIHINQQLAADADDLTGHRLFLGQFEFGSLGSLDNDRVTINVSSSSGQGSWATVESVLFAEVAPCASATTVSDIENEDDDDVSSTYVSQSQDTAGGPTPTSVTVTIVLCATLVVLVVSAVVWRLNSGSKLRNNLSKSNWGHGLTRNDALGSGPLSPLQWDSSTEQLGTSASSSSPFSADHVNGMVVAWTSPERMSLTGSSSSPGQMMIPPAGGSVGQHSIFWDGGAHPCVSSTDPIDMEMFQHPQLPSDTRTAPGPEIDFWHAKRQSGHDEIV